ncbi:dimethylaniline monooxygenase, putative [Ricinus communis]|uniref:Flavin-containing monooxygenase n=1 Tax=Ricinus communis TaxID=3988 RepID=B9RR56_RICCO|nr:dimethylaniline monooxygenase, putative [Ricinus communis]|eukprot:XP_002516225.1 probable flavin-containing monooxygenase 1 [Ricinus communis]
MARQSHLLVSRIGIIGAGVSGLAVLKQLSHHNPLVFESSNSLGGVWKSCSYHSTKLQSCRADYEFSDFPWPNRDDPSFPSHLEILDYLTSYAQCFDLFKHIRFNSKVVEVRFVGDREPADCNGTYGEYGSLLPGHPVWEVAVQTNDSDTVQWYGFEFLIICIGKYGDIPKIPEFPHNKGPEIFKGKVMHPLDYCKLEKEAASELLKGKKVVVVGFKKSAIDLALECAEANQGPDWQPCTMVVRTLHWTVPHYWVWGLPFFLFFSTRSSQFIHERPNQSLLKALLCLLLSPMRHLVSKFIESYLLYKLPLQKYGLKPDHPFVEDYASCQMALMPENFFSEADKGKILFKRAFKWWFTKEGLEFEDNTRLEADVVMLATGYDGMKKLKKIMPEPFCSLLEYPAGVMPLYRGTIHPLIPNMALLGYIESVSNLHTAELRSMWLARLLDNRFKLPTVEKMLEQVSKEIEAMKRTTRFYKKKHCISTFSINHSDEICEEMGWSSWRKKNFLAEAFSPYGTQDYRQV